MMFKELSGNALKVIAIVASLKDAGKKLFAYIRMQEASAQELLNKIR